MDCCREGPLPALLAVLLLSIPQALSASDSLPPAFSRALTSLAQPAQGASRTSQSILNDGSKHRILAQGGQTNGLPVPSALRAAAGPGARKLALARTALAKQGATAFFRLMDTAEFADVVTDLMSKSPVTLLIPTDTAVAKAYPRIKKLSKVQLKQLVGYHILKKFCTFPFLVSVAKRTEFATADYDFTVAKKSEKGVRQIGLGPPAAPAAVGIIIKQTAYLNPQRNVMAHIVNAVLFPPKFN